uniref:Uncharacterized protein n=1 Tax=Anguilla anguilla TaxID=7936 RepID=A0A0E9PLK8_ANGAN
MVSNMYACHKYNDEGLTSRLLMKQYVDIKPPYRKVALSLEKCSNTLNKSIFHVIKIPENPQVCLMLHLQENWVIHYSLIL